MWGNGTNGNRQRMINLMYIVFIALMGLGVHQDQEAELSPNPTVQIKDNVPRATVQETAPTGEVAEHARQMPLARAIPRSRVIVKGGAYEADLHLVQPIQQGEQRILVNGLELQANTQRYRTTAERVGVQHYSGHIEWRQSDGKVQQFPFTETYEVIEPTIAIAPHLTQLLYAGIDNRVNISVAGLSQASLRVTAHNATLRQEGTSYLIKPEPNAKEVILKVSSLLGDGKVLSLGEQSLRVRPLPPPMPYVALTDAKGSSQRFRGGRIAKHQLLTSLGLSAAIDDGVLDVAFVVQSFQTIHFDGLGNAIPEVSVGAKFSERQQQQIQEAARGKRLYITEVVARGPDGSIHRLPPMELILQ